ncbi:hypothetical protein [Bernardetia sp.]|uniref:hypothetical protein n=1 Tax=Bernardetia sp. TaxID=1937974 RepID=UPI0025B9BB3C|nr:hypothetical protein [Bernardetia sp.]
MNNPKYTEAQKAKLYELNCEYDRYSQQMRVAKDEKDTHLYKILKQMRDEVLKQKKEIRESKHY